jgi:hypothetical protein
VEQTDANGGTIIVSHEYDRDADPDAKCIILLEKNKAFRKKIIKFFITGEPRFYYNPYAA